MLTPQQKRIVDSNSKYILVRAGAGTGKTEVLSQRILRLLEDDPSFTLRNIAVITFTNKAAENLANRLERYLYKRWRELGNAAARQRFRYELESLNSCQISTIHRFCRSILDLAGPVCLPELQYSPAFRVGSGSLNLSLELTLEEWFKEHEIRNEVPEHAHIMPSFELRKAIRSVYTLLRSQGLSVSKVANLTVSNAIYEHSLQPQTLKTELGHLLALLERHHKEQRFASLDPDDLLEYSLRLLRNRPDITSAVRARYQHIFVDEYQDTSRFQAKILEEICNGSKDSPCLFIVGDVKQSIYQFRGANLTSYKQTADWMKNHGEEMHLSTNFRSTPELIEFVNNTFSGLAHLYPEYRFEPEPLMPGSELHKADAAPERPYDWILTSDNRLQCDHVASYIRDQLKAGRNPNEFAVLFRTNYPIRDYANSLMTNGVPLQTIGAGDFFNQPETVDTYKVLNYLLHEYSDFHRQEALETIYFDGNEEHLDRCCNELVGGAASRRTPAQLIDELYRKSGVRERLMGNDRQAVANLNKLKSLVREVNRSENWQLLQLVEWLREMIVTRADESQADCYLGPEQADVVTLMTIHKAKGLEFPVVILPELDHQLSRSSVNPPVVLSREYGLEFSYVTRRHGENIRISSSHYSEAVKEYQEDLYAEEMRILYVALTRAKRKLLFVGSKTCPPNTPCFQNWLMSVIGSIKNV